MLRGPRRRYASPNFVGRCEPWLADYSFFADLAGFTAAFATKSSSPAPNTVVLGPSARSDQVSCRSADLLRSGVTPTESASSSSIQRHERTWSSALRQDYESALSERALEQPHDASVGADVDRVGRRHLGQAVHGHDVTADRDNELRAGRQPDLAHRHDVIAGRALGVGIGREAELGLGDADRYLAKAHRLELRELVAHGLGHVDVLGAVDLAGDGADFLQQRHVVGIEQLHLALAALDDLYHRARHVGGALATLGPMIGHHRLDAELGAGRLHQGNLGIGVGAEAVDRDHRYQAE